MRRSPLHVLIVLAVTAPAIALAAAHDHAIGTSFANAEQTLGRGGYEEIEATCPPGAVMTELLGSFNEVIGNRAVPLLDVHSHKIGEGGVLASNTSKRSARVRATGHCLTVEAGEDGKHGLKVGKVQNYTLVVRRGKTSKVRADCAPDTVAVVPGYQWDKRVAGAITRSRPAFRGNGHEFAVQGERKGKVVVSIRCLKLAAGPHKLSIIQTVTAPSELPAGALVPYPIDCSPGSEPLLSRYDLPKEVSVEAIVSSDTGRTFMLRNRSRRGALVSVGLVCAATRTTIAG